MHIPSTYQNQARLSLPTIHQQQNQERTFISLRLGKLGITYSGQDTPRADSSSSANGQQPSLSPTTNFAQELSLALVQSTRQSGTTDIPTKADQTSYNQRIRVQAYTFQADYTAAVSTQSINALV